MAKFLALFIMITLVAICILQPPTLALQGKHGSNDHLLQNNGHGKLHQSQCKAECDLRCSKTKTKQRKHWCMSFCEPCCKRCQCVPPGTSGNKEQCPCYNNWKTKKGGPKCP